MKNIKRFFIVSKAFKVYLNKIEDVYIYNDFLKHILKKENIRFKSIEYFKKNPDSKEILKNKSELVNDKYVNYTEVLGSALNQIHTKNYKKEYWAQSLSLGLVKYIALCYDFFENIEASFDNKKHNCFLISKENYIEINDFEHLRNTLESSIGREILFDIYIRKFHSNSVQGEFNYYLNENYKENSLISFLRKTKKNIKSILYSFFKKKIKVGILGSYFGSQYKKKLFSLSDNKIGSIEIFPPKSKSNYDFSKRMVLQNYFTQNDRFDTFFIETIKYLFPKSHIEDYLNFEYHISSKLKAYSSLHSLISENWIGHTFNSMIIAYLKKDGVIHYYNEHNCFFHPYIGNQVQQAMKLCDFYLSMGWEDELNKKLIPIGSLYDFKIRRNNDFQFDILYVSGLLIPYPAIFTGAYGYVSDGVKICVEFEKEFFKNLEPKTINSIYHRPYPNKSKIQYDFYDENFIMNKEYEFLKNTPINEDFKSILSKSKVIVCNYVSTTYIQGIVSDIPTIVLLPKSYYLNDTYATFFKDLIDCKIVFSDPTECANHLNTILDDPNKWWLSQKVRINRNKFLKKNYKSPEAALNFYENLV